MDPRSKLLQEVAQNERRYRALVARLKRLDDEAERLIKVLTFVPDSTGAPCVFLENRLTGTSERIGSLDEAERWMDQKERARRSRP